VDCSHLVHAIYKEAGLGYPYADTHSFPPSGYFVKLPQGVQAQDGDVVLFSGHMGIFVGGHDGEIISAQGSTSKPGKVQYGEAEWFGAKVGVFRWAR
jgi:cell wall-associated NlpC family hydrolase